MRPTLFAVAALAVALGPLSTATAQPEAPETAAKPAAPLPLKSGTAVHAMVSAANPLAVATGVKILKAGGTAVDAAVGIQAVLGLVEPQSSGLGGGAFMIYYDAKAKKAVAYDGREFAPAGARPEMFLGDGDKPIPFRQTVVSGRATGVPGAVAMLYMAQKDYGRLAWKGLFSDAEKLARNGFTISPRLGNDIASTFFPESSQPDLIAYFTKPDGTKYKTGDLLKNPAYAATLERIATEGPDALLKGRIAADIVARTTQPPLAGTMTLADLAAYEPIRTEALCLPYHAYTVCTPQAPSGGPAVLELMGILANTDIAAHGPEDPQGWYLFAEASRLAYADRDFYEGDPAFVKTPVSGLLDPAYLKARAAEIGPMAVKEAEPGKPAGAQRFAQDHTVEPGGTSSFVVVDQYGNVLAMTTTVESFFGAGRMVDGFFLNNQLTDFSATPLAKNGEPAANAVGPRKRPRSSMSPTLVLDKDGRFVSAVGSPGGIAIVAYVGKALTAMIDWKMPVPQAVALPNLIAREDSVTPETDFDPKLVAALKAKGEPLTSGRNEESGLHGIQRTPTGLLGGADPRREGIAEGF